MRIILGVLSWLLVGNVIAITATGNLSASYNVARICSITNVPASINLNAADGQAFGYSATFNIDCNAQSGITLTLSSLNATATQMRLKSNSGSNYINYSATVNGDNYPSGVAQSITPNASSYLLDLNFAAPDYADTFKDTLTFTLTY